MTQIALDDGRHGLADAVNAVQQRAPDQDAAERTEDRQNRDRTGERIPEAPFERHVARQVATHQQVIAAGQRRVDQ